MKTPLPLAFWAAAMLCATSQAHAQDVRYDFTGTYADTTPTTSLTAPGAKFTFEFVVPASVPNAVSMPFYVEAPLLSGSYAFGGRTVYGSSGTYLDANGGGDIIDITLNAASGGIDFFTQNLGGDSSYFNGLSGGPDAFGNAHFIPGDLGTKLVSGVIFSPTHGNGFSVNHVAVSIKGTEVTQPAPVPEPSSLGLLVVGLAACGAVAWTRRRRAGWPIPLRGPFEPELG